MNAPTKKSAVVISRTLTQVVPIGWGQSELTQFLSVAEQQAHATYAILPKWVQALELVDTNLTVSSQTLFHEIDPSRRISSSLFLRAFSTYRAACRLALSGQVYETVVLVRSIVESATYAWACGNFQNHRDSWNRRDDGLSEKKTAKNLFKWGELMQSLDVVDRDLAERIRSLYDQTIEFGAHPNVSGVSLSSEISPTTDGRYEISSIFLHGDEAILLSILDILRAMELVYRLLELLFKDRLRILGIDQKMDAERRLVLDLIRRLEEQQKIEDVAQSS